MEFMFASTTMGCSSPLAAWMVWTVTEFIPALAWTSWVLPSSMPRSMNRMRSPRVNVVALWTDWIVVKSTSA